MASRKDKEAMRPGVSVAIALCVRATVSATANPPVTMTTGGAYIRNTIFEIGFMRSSPTRSFGEHACDELPVISVYELRPSVNW